MIRVPRLATTTALALVATGCVGTPTAGTLTPFGTFRLPIWNASTIPVTLATAAPAPAQPSVAPDAKQPAVPPPAVSTAAPLSPPAPAGGSGGGSNGGAGSAVMPSLAIVSIAADLADITVGADGKGRLKNKGQRIGSITVTAPGYITSTVVLDAVSTLQVGDFYLSPAIGAPIPDGIATIFGAPGATSPGEEVAYRSPTQSALVHVTAGPDGGFTMDVPVTGVEQGIVVAFTPTETPAVALTRVQLTAGQTTPVTGLVPQPPASTILAPAPPAGMALAGAHLALLDGPIDSPARLDLIGFTVGIVPQYTFTALSLAGAFNALRADGMGGSSVLTTSSDGPTFLLPPDLKGLPAMLIPNTELAWPAVDGASLYTLRLKRTGDGLPIWEGASATPHIVLPGGLPAGSAVLELEMRAWSTNNVAIYTVADLRALRVPVFPTINTGRVAWASRTGLHLAAQ